MSQRQQEHQSVVIPLQELGRVDAQLQSVFDKYDTDNDGKLSIAELRALIESGKYDNDIPAEIVNQIMSVGDADGDRFLDYNEFKDMVRQPELGNYFIHLLFQYVHTIIPRRQPAPSNATDGGYEGEYKWFPLPVCMLLFSLEEFVLFAVDAAAGYVDANGPIATAVVYNPDKRYEAWRYLSYMFVHCGWTHLIVNLCVQIFLGTPLEMVHKWWRVLIIYLAGVIAGSLGTSVACPSATLTGASGGVSALLTAHVSTIVLNWSQMECALLQLLVVLVFAVTITGPGIYERFVLGIDSHIGHMAHLSGAIAGLLVGIGILRNLEVRSWERKLWWFSIFIYFALMTIAVLMNVFWKTHFPISTAVPGLLVGADYTRESWEEEAAVPINVFFILMLVAVCTQMLHGEFSSCQISSRKTIRTLFKKDVFIVIL